MMMPDGIIRSNQLKGDRRDNCQRGGLRKRNGQVARCELLNGAAGLLIVMMMGAGRVVMGFMTLVKRIVPSDIGS